MRSWALALLVTLVAACSKNDKPPPPTTGTPTPKTETGPGATAEPGQQLSEAQTLYTRFCATCHGADGTGLGEVKLDPKPRDYTDPAWQTTVSDDDLKKIIVEGGAAVGKSATMPASSQLRDKPQVLSELVAIIRGFAKKQ